MRYSCLAWTSVLLSGTLLPAQQTQTPAAADANQTTLMNHLQQWEAKMKGIDSLSAQITREKEDNVFRTREIYKGEAKYMKPDLFRLELYKKDKPTIFEKLIVTGKYLYEYNQLGQEIRVHELPPPKEGGKPGDNNFMSFMFDMKADEAKRRYDIKLTGTDKYYVYLEIRPRRAEDKQEFQVAQVALFLDSYMPRMLIYREANGNKITLDIQVDAKPKVERTDFIQPELPKGWQWRPLLAPKKGTAQTPKSNEVAPRVIRQQQP